jgi:putative transposase
MPYDPDRHHRRSIRLQGYDYARAGAYSVTVCVHNRECLLSEIVNGEVRLTEIGQIVIRAWDDLPLRFPGVELDTFVVMPNHIHGIIVIEDRPKQDATSSQGAASSAPTLGLIVRAFKSIAAIACNRALDRADVPFWQRNYYEHVIRDEDDLNRIRCYIADNPACWPEDPENPARHAA